MNRIGIILLSLFFSSLVLLLPQKSLAHPGNTASDGCHYCRTNCSKWGEVYGARHCHGGRSKSRVRGTQAPRVCKDNFWKFIALGEQKCDYEFWDFATGWGLAYAVGGFFAYSYFKKDN